MKHECAWCGKDLGAGPGPKEAVSHGICEDCAKVLKAEAAAIVKTWAEDVKMTIAGHESC